MSSPPGRQDQVIGFGGDRRFELLVNAVTDYAIYLLDINGYVASWNRGAQRFKGYTADEIIGQHFSVFYTPEDRATGLPATALRTAAEEGKFEQEGWRVRKDGTRFWTSVVIDPVLDVDGQLIGYAKITRDITDKREAALALRQSEQRFRMLVQGVRDYAIYMLDPEGLVSNWNAGASLIKGYTADEVVGTHFSRFYTEEDRAAGEPARALQTALTKGKYETESWRLRKDGTRFRASVLIDPIYNDDGSLVGFAKVTRDLTERWKAQQEVQATREALAQAQKMEAVGRLTGGVAHDFNNLLTVIRASADLLARPDLGEEKRQRYIQAISETAERAAQLTGQLLAFARRQPLKPEKFEIAGRLHGMGQIIRTTLGSPVAVEYVVETDVGAVDADPNQFETAILNMVINARDAMPTGGTLRIGAKQVDAVPALRRHAAVRGSFVAVWVEDNGTGIDEDTLSRIFEPFFTTKEINKGTGLGLSQVYGFAKQSGGDIAVESTVGQGSRFTLYLPRCDGFEQATNMVTAAPEVAAVRRSVLLVEDNEAVGGFARSLLEELGQQVTWATGGEEALRILDERRGAFDLVFSDVVMPGINGIDMAQEVRRRWPDLPVVLTSGYSHVLAEEGSHGFDLLQKPYTVDGLLGVLHGKVPEMK
ncbi:hybrid sensor histidine kinase/response regulator [Sphingomonas crusticola]|uniref:hybrid sensor histidine kinase/response regulator n=1 Tax=Sphingomonas crusticola TaxID=1697973 RepID=UPI000E286FAD|nr:PAS domain-containing sensor histidine kinase [Sphingomonas crusticola]